MRRLGFGGTERSQLKNKEFTGERLAGPVALLPTNEVQERDGLSMVRSWLCGAGDPGLMKTQQCQSVAMVRSAATILGPGAVGRAWRTLALDGDR
jgi:hypothetical protein